MKNEFNFSAQITFEIIKSLREFQIQAQLSGLPILDDKIESQIQRLSEQMKTQMKGE